MDTAVELPGIHWFGFMKDVGIRVGVYAGLSLSLVFTAWLLIANRVAFLEPLAMERNIIAAALLALLACIPLMRFFRSPGDLLVSGLVGWSMLALTYGILCIKFVLLDEYYSAFHIFVLGAISYLVFATVSWIGTIIWRVHAANSSHIPH
ncbi:MAG: hypothetical protein WAM58_16070 [Candidatus Acidiferrum sp.]